MTALRIDTDYATACCALASQDHVIDLLGALAGIGYEVDTRIAQGWTRAFGFSAGLDARRCIYW